MGFKVVLLLTTLVWLVAGRVVTLPSVTHDAYNSTFVTNKPHSLRSSADPRVFPRFDPTAIIDENGFAKYHDKGGDMYCMMTTTDQHAGRMLRDSRTPPSAQSLFKSRFGEQTDKWNWWGIEEESEPCVLDVIYQFHMMWTDLQLNPTSIDEGGDNFCADVSHFNRWMKDENGDPIRAASQYYHVDGKEYRATGAEYAIVVNVKGGAIYCTFVLSPFYAARSLWYNDQRDPDPDSLPQLRALSDFLWAYWAQVAGKDNWKNIRYFFMLSIENPETLGIIAKCLTKQRRQLRSWPGATFEVDPPDPIHGECGKALVGSPNGAAFAYFLLQHKRQLGPKRITKVTVFAEEGEDDVKFLEPSLCFWVEDAPGWVRPNPVGPNPSPIPMPTPAAVEVAHDVQKRQMTIMATETTAVESTVCSNNKSSLSKRFNPDNLMGETQFQEFIGKGCRHVAAMRGDIFAAGLIFNDARNPPSGESNWQDNLAPALQTWFWHVLPVYPGECDIITLYGFKGVTEALGLDGRDVVDGGNIRCADIEHWDPNRDANIHAQTYQVGGRNYWATGALYKFGIDTIGGAIYCKAVKSPIYAAAQNWGEPIAEIQPEELPALRSLSDILWAYWQDAATDIKNIRYFFMVGIINPTTNMVIASCLASVRSELKPWPGTSFSVDTDEGKALLGSPNGVAFAWFLAQHKQRLGPKAIFKITVFRNDFNNWVLSQTDAHLVFHVDSWHGGSTAPEPQPIPRINVHQKVARHPKPTRTKSKSVGKNTGTLVRRYQPDFTLEPEEFQQEVAKGTKLNCLIQVSDEAAGLMSGDRRNPSSAASIWQTDIEAKLVRWSWYGVTPREGDCDVEQYYYFGSILQALGLNGHDTRAGGNVWCGHIEHWNVHEKDGNGRIIPAENQRYQVDGKTYVPTRAHYQFGIDDAGQAIYIFNVKSPVNSAAEIWRRRLDDIRDDELPALRALSDVLWFYWAHNNNNVKDLKYFFMMNIVNSKTGQIIASCFKNTNQKLRIWPGVTYKLDTPEGQALLASPNGAVFAYFLFQHKAHLGPKVISAVTVFSNDDGEDSRWADPYLLFHVESRPDFRSDENAKRDLSPVYVGTDDARSFQNFNIEDIPAPSSCVADAEVPTRLESHNSPTKVKRFDPVASLQPNEIRVYYNKACNFWNYMTRSDEVAGRLLRDQRQPPSAASVWSTVDELTTWGWFIVAQNSLGCPLQYYEPVMAAYQLSGTDTDHGGNLQCVYIKHQDTELSDKSPLLGRKYEVGGREYSYTGARYKFQVDQVGGAIYSDWLISPLEAARTNWQMGRDVDPQLLPAIRAYSDIMWAYWARGNPNVKSIRFFFMKNVINPQSEALIATALRSVDSALLGWPGTVFPINSPGYKLILASPNGASFAYFLFQHKRELGNKNILGIRVWRAMEEESLHWVEPHLMFIVADVLRQQDSIAQGQGMQKREEREGVRIFEVVH